MTPEIIEWHEFKNMEYEGPNVEFVWSGEGDYLFLIEKQWRSKEAFTIEYDSIKTPLQLIGWVDHMLEKDWFNAWDAKELIRLICEKREWKYQGL